MYLVKTDALGNTQWQKAIGGKGWDVGKTVLQTYDGNYLEAGFSDSFNQGEFGFYLVQTDAKGKKLWEKTLGEGKYDESFSTRFTEDGGFIVAGWWADQLKSYQWRNEDVQVYVAKIKTGMETDSSLLLQPQDADGAKNIKAGSVALDVPIIMQNNHILVPIRPIAESLGAEVDWDSEAQILTMTSGDKTAKLKIGSTTALINSEPVEIDVPASIYKNQIYVPLKFVVDSLGATMNWDDDTKTVSIITGQE